MSVTEEEKPRDRGSVNNTKEEKSEMEEEQKVLVDDVRLDLNGKEEKTEQQLKEEIEKLRGQRSSMIQRRKAENKVKKERKQAERKEKMTPVI